jgi:hypothetical protein
MYKAFSGIIDINDKVTWKLGVDSHSDLAKLGGYADKQLGEFAKFEITPKNGDYLNPDEWVFLWGEATVPSWCGTHEKELALQAHKKWLKQLNKILVRKKIVHPFKITPPKIGTKQIRLLKNWVSVGDSVGDSVWVSVGDSVGVSVVVSVWESVGVSVGDSVWVSVGDSVWVSVGDSVGASVWDSVGDSVGASVGAYTGSFFKIPVWKYVKHPKGKYPYQPLVTLWNQGLVPSFDGTVWRLHGGEKATVLFSITKTELKKYK